MGSFTTLHGYILGIGTHAAENAARIATLPEIDERPVPLPRGMFAVPANENNYWDQVIAFGLLYNGVQSHWEDWLAKFEALLRTLYWEEAHVYLETEDSGSYHFQWRVDPPEEEEAAAAFWQGPTVRWIYRGPHKNLPH